MAEAEISNLLKELHGKYSQAKSILSLTKDDPPNEPFKSKYKAADIFREIENSLTCIKSDTAVDSSRVPLLKALIYYELGTIMYETEDLTSSDEYLQKSWEIISENALKPECVILSISVLNELGILWSGRGEVQKAHDYLKKAENIYGEYKLGKGVCPIDIPNLFVDQIETNKNQWEPLEKALTYSLYYLAQIYEHMNENEMAAKYCHITLKRQLDSNDYDPLDWARNCATLSQYFISKDKFAAARHVLACASYVINQYESKIGTEIGNKDDNERWEHFNRCKADIFRCWTKYAIHILMLSREKEINYSPEMHGNQTNNTLRDTDDFIKVYRLLKDADVKDLENKITCYNISSFDDAKLIFLFGIESLNKSKTFYVLDDFAFDYVEIIQDNSKLYKYLLFFEDCPDRKCKMHKRRINMLEEVLQKLNPQFYLGSCRQLIFELAETYSEMMDIKLKILHEGTASEHAIKKVNFLASKSIEHYKSFIDTLRDTKKELPKTFADNVVRPALVAYFCLGRLYSKLIVPSSSKEIENLQKTESCYKIVVRYIEKNPQHEPVIIEELSVIKDMIELIPSKIKSLNGTL